MSVLVMMAAAVDTHNGSVDTVDWFRVSKISKHDVSSREGLVTTDAKHDDQLSKVKFLSLASFLLRKSIRESDEYRLL
jgi:hypothetical protein